MRAVELIEACMAHGLHIRFYLVTAHELGPIQYHIRVIRFDGKDHHAIDQCGDSLNDAAWRMSGAIRHEGWVPDNAFSKSAGGVERNPNSGHGHVYPRPDGVKARCGGPALGCRECAADLAQKQQAIIFEAMK